MRSGVRAAVWAFAVSAALLVGGCSQRSSGDSGNAAAATTTAPPPSPTAAPTSRPPASTVSLPSTCTDVFTLSELDQAVGGGRHIVGQTRYLKIAAEPKIKRTGRVLCRYGVHQDAKKKDVIPVEASISAYTDEAAAATRVASTVDDLRSSGAAPADVRVGDVQATVLTTPNGGTLVFAKGQRTVAVTITKDVATGDKAKGVLTALGTAIAQRLV